MFWEKDVETMPVQKLREYQLSRLKETIKFATLTPYYSNLFKKLSITPDQIKTLDDLKRIPYTTKENMRENFPYGFLAVPKEDVIRLHCSSGTTGSPTVIYHTKHDIEQWADLVARCIYMTGVRKNDVFQNMMSYGLFTGGLGLHYGAEKVGVLTIPSGAGNSRRQITLMKDFGTTVIHIIPSYALVLARVFDEMGLDPKKDVKLRIAFVGAEPHSEDVRHRIEEIYGLHAYNSYGLSEMNGPGVAFECQQKNGMHVWEDAYIIEVIDPQTLELLPDGDEGELIFTTLGRYATPLLRYRTRDLAYIYTEPCSCGRTHRRISRIKGRTDDMFIIKGVNIFPIQVERVLMNIPEAGNNYVIVLDRKDIIDEMTVKIEIKKIAMDASGRETLQTHIAKTLKDELLVTPKVELMDTGTLPATEGKAVRVIDNRKV